MVCIFARQALIKQLYLEVVPTQYRLIGLESGSFLRGDYKITQRWAKVFLKALVERNSVMVEVFYMISIPKKYDQKPTILNG